MSTIESADDTADDIAADDSSETAADEIPLGEPVPSWEPLGRALEDRLMERECPEMAVSQEDGERWTFDVEVFFREVEDFPYLEWLALEECRGRVLDLGAGAGSHALELLERGLEVTAVDLDPRAVGVMRRRGVGDARRGDLFELLPGEGEARWETVLLMMNGIGVVGDLAGLDRFLSRAAELVAPGGQILLDSCDLRCNPDPREFLRMASRCRAERYRGETRQRLDYDGRVGDWFPWIYLDPETLAEHAASHGWNVEILDDDEEGSYLARLTSAEGSVDGV